MHKVISQQFLILAISTTLFICSSLNVSFGKSTHVEQTLRPQIILVKDVKPNDEPYIADVRQQLQKSRALLNDITKMRTQASSEERKEDLYYP
ncbi:MAG: hypothetical protein H0X47_08595, partial [Nitrospirales bacterium]|nr:hypothetical protein [Nitrospirales bacterium]